MTPSLVEEVAALRKQNDVLLSLLGEKEEELEAAMADMREVKGMYKAQMDELLYRLTASEGTGVAKATEDSSWVEVSSDQFQGAPSTTLKNTKKATQPPAPAVPIHTKIR